MDTKLVNFINQNINNHTFKKIFNIYNIYFNYVN